MNKVASQAGTVSSTLREEASLSRNVKVAAREFGLEHTDTALALIELGDFYANQERYVDAADTYKRALDIYEALGEGHQLLAAMAMRSLSNALISQGKFSEAMLMNRDARELVRSYQ